MSDQSSIFPGSSAAYLAFIRALGIDENEDLAVTQRAIDALNIRAGLARDEYAQGAMEAQENIADSAESRGMFRSGRRLTEEARSTARYGRGLANNELDMSMRADDLILDLARRRAENERRRAEQAYEVTAGLYEEME